VAQDGNAQGRARSRTWTWPPTWPVPWPVGGARPAWGAAQPRPAFVIATLLRQWAGQELAASRLLPWLAVAYGLGIVVYFTAEHEPAWWAATTLATFCALCAVLLRRQLTAFVVALFITAIASGFAVATLRTALID
jgi:competence protein ComEC